MLKQIEDIELGERGCMWVWVGGEIGIDTIKFYSTNIWIFWQKYIKYTFQNIKLEMPFRKSSNNIVDDNFEYTSLFWYTKISILEMNANFLVVTMNLINYSQ